MKLKIIAFLTALAVSVPMAAEAAPAGGLTAHGYSAITTLPHAANAAVDPATPTTKVDKVWYRRGFGFRRFGYRRFGYRYGWRRPYYGYYRPFYRRRFFYY